MNVAESVLAIESNQCQLLSEIKFGSKVSYIYNPLDYARETHSCYVRKYCNTQKIVLFLGMNPGPFGMAQNGVCATFQSLNMLKNIFIITLKYQLRTQLIKKKKIYFKYKPLTYFLH